MYGLAKKIGKTVLSVVIAAIASISLFINCNKNFELIND